MNDVQVLMVNGCLEIPPKAAVNIFVRKYFLLLHPLLPIIDEAEFWEIYNQSNKFLSCLGKMSLFVFQAMLLASCAVLYNTGFESDPLARAQGALLLTFHTTAEDPQATMTWNICAIQNAMTVSSIASNIDLQTAVVVKKRLLWSVFVRDRILWLGRHRRPQFISANFNIGMGLLEELDIADEINSSPVHTPDSKRLLLKLFQAQCRLALILSDVNAIAFSASEAYSPQLSVEGLHSRLAKVQMLKSRLAQWREVWMPLPQTAAPEQEAIDILTNITLMHYESARIALSHHETFLVEQHLELIQDRSSTMLLGIAKELKDSISNVTQKLSYFASVDLTENMPLSVLASSGTPMVLSAIDVKLSSSQSDMLDRRRTLDACSKIIKQAGKVYDVTDFFSQGTNHILQLAYAITKNLFIDDNTHRSDVLTAQPGNEDGQARAIVPASNGRRVKGWVDAFVKYPRAYLVISSCIDHSLATGRLPRDELLPPLIRGSVFMILGRPKLPWTITAPTNSNTDHAGRYNEEKRQDQDENQESVSLVDTRNPLLNDPWYWSLIHDVTAEPQHAYDALCYAAHRTTQMPQGLI
ncbi:hypothetical protein HFD88_002374 [Aspergillus terreus]|nr:hypothetical protein HFD88_002374 [Aspergillus terreus]